MGVNLLRLHVLGNLIQKKKKNGKRKGERKKGENWNKGGKPGEGKKDP